MGRATPELWGWNDAGWTEQPQLCGAGIEAGWAEQPWLCQRGRWKQSSALRSRPVCQPGAAVPQRSQQDSPQEGAGIEEPELQPGRWRLSSGAGRAELHRCVHIVI